MRKISMKYNNDVVVIKLFRKILKRRMIQSSRKILITTLKDIRTMMTLRLICLGSLSQKNNKQNVRWKRINPKKTRKSQDIFTPNTGVQNCSLTP